MEGGRRSCHAEAHETGPKESAAIALHRRNRNCDCQTTGFLQAANLQLDSHSASSAVNGKVLAAFSPRLAHCRSAQALPNRAWKSHIFLQANGRQLGANSTGLLRVTACHSATPVSL